MKSVLRIEILDRLKSLSAAQKLEMSQAIQNNLKDCLVDEAGTWVGYQALDSEPQINWQNLSDKISWAFPVTDGEYLKFKVNGSKFEKVSLGMYEPADGTEVKAEEISGFVIPALGYDRDGYRLGRGRGFYDKSLKGLINKKIGVCFDSSFYEELPQETHDLKCDLVVTDKQIYRVNQSEGVRKWN